MLYIVYAIARGSIEGWYAYWFLNPAAQSPAGFAFSLCVLFCAFGLTATALVAADRQLGRDRPASSEAASV